ncbi:MAG: complex I NDUFA9 subunit family protein [Zoogloeaceae bacterium]|nr:complex I NDUFA9 subunit family protein [Zoogloeaceae bacterium]
MCALNVLIIGGSGFVGSAVANRLAAAGCALRIPTRRAARMGHLKVLPRAEVIDADVHDPATLAGLMAGQDAVVNLVGVLHSPPGSPYGPAFARAHVELPRKIVAACLDAGVGRLVHISALGADPAGPSEYQRSKAAGEAMVRGADPALAWTILRPSVIFGRQDHFLNLFAGLLRTFPVLPLAGASTRFQPVWVEDVAEVVALALLKGKGVGGTFELAGPTVHTLGQLVHFVGDVIGCRRLIMPLPEFAALLQARMMELAPNPLMSRDNVRSMRVDNVASGVPLPFGLVPHALQAVAPGYLGEASMRGGYGRFRTAARRR